jgi:hypothetical protein
MLLIALYMGLNLNARVHCRHHISIANRQPCGGILISSTF